MEAWDDVILKIGDETRSRWNATYQVAAYGTKLDERTEWLICG